MVAHRVAEVAVIVAETDPEQALSLFSFALELNAESARILAQRGMVLGPRLQRWEDALADFLR